MKNLILMLAAFFISNFSNAQIGLLDSSYVAKLPGASQVGIFHSAGGIIQWLDENGDANLFIDSEGYLWTQKNTPSISNINVGAVHFHGGSQLNIGMASFVPVDTLGSVAAWLSGDVNIDGTLYFPSDEHLKKNIKTLNNVLPKIMELNPTAYEYSDQYNLAKGYQTGLIAQELKSVFPHLVAKKTMLLPNDENVWEGDQQNYQAINYIGLISILTKGIQEQQQIIDDQATRLAELERNVELLLEKENKNSNIQKTTLNDAPQQEFYMNQNFPNPFSKNTTIEFRVPSNAKNAYLIFQNLEGKILKKILVEGEGQIEVSLENLANGIYLYSLQADGEIFLTKKMQVGF